MATNEKIIWDYFMNKIGNPYGVAGLMGNLKAESDFRPNNLSSIGNKKLGMTDSEYTAAVDNGSYTKFVNDGYDYGLAQWVYHTRKSGLLNYAKSVKQSIGDLTVQLDFIWQELQQYSSVYKVLLFAESIKEATEVVMLKYEKPADQSDTAKAKRVGYAETIFRANVGYPGKWIRVTGDSVNIRYGDSIKYRIAHVATAGDMFNVVAESNATGWCAIRYEDEILWISNKFVKWIE